jgi:hypothetical protein
MATADLDGYWMAKAVIVEPREGTDEVTTAEIFIAGPATDNGGMEGVLLIGLPAFVALRALLNKAYEEWEHNLTLGAEDIPQ